MISERTRLEVLTLVVVAAAFMLTAKLAWSWTPEAIAAVGISSLLVYLWADSIVGTFGDWQAFRDARGVRAFLTTIVIFGGTLAFLFGSLTLFVSPDLIGVSRLIGWIVRGGLLIVGVVIWITRRRRVSERRHPE